MHHNISQSTGQLLNERLNIWSANWSEISADQATALTGTLVFAQNSNICTICTMLLYLCNALLFQEPHLHNDCTLVSVYYIAMRHESSSTVERGGWVQWDLEEIRLCDRGSVRPPALNLNQQQHSEVGGKGSRARQRAAESKQPLLHQHHHQVHHQHLQHQEWVRRGWHSREGIWRQSKTDKRSQPQDTIIAGQKSHGRQCCGWRRGRWSTGLTVSQL